MSDIVTVQLELPQSAYDFVSYMAEYRSIDIKAYLLSGIKDLIMGELQYMVELPEDDGSNVAVMDRYLGTRTGEAMQEFSTAPEIATKLGMGLFLKDPNVHNFAWDFDALTE